MHEHDPALNRPQRRAARFRGIVVISTAAVLLAPIVVPHQPDPAGAITSRPRGTDFNGDGYDELVVADPYFDSGAADSGAVWVLPGSATGPRPTAASGWSQSRAGMPGDPGADELFGESWTAGDFNNDAFDDVAICIPGEGVNGVGGAGAVSIIFGTPTGLRATNSRLLSRATPGIPGSASANEKWCSSGLVAGDFNSDGRDDIAIASPDADVSGRSDAGSVTVLFGSPSGPRGLGAMEISQATSGVPGSPSAGGSFSYLGLGTGDFNGDGYDDITVSAAYLDVDGKAEAGGVYVLRGSASGIRTAATQLITRSTPGVPGNPVDNENFGLGFPAVADWNHDGYDDIVVSDARATVGGVERAGQIVLLRGSASGLVGAGGKTIDENSPGVPGVAAFDELFGSPALTTGDFDGNGRPDLAASAAEEALAGGNEGAFYTFPGTATSIGTFGARVFSQDTTGVPGVATANTWYSEGHLWTGDFNGDGYDDLVVPCGYCDIGTLANAGYLTIFRGSAGGITAVGARWIKRSSIPGRANEANTSFGYSY